MTDGINRLSGYGNYGVGGYLPSRGNNVAHNEQEEGQAVAHNYEETQVDPSKVMDFLANHNFFVAAPSTGEVEGVNTEVQDRVAGYMEQFEMIYGIVLEEFGEKLAPLAMDAVMDRLIGMV